MMHEAERKPLQLVPTLVLISQLHVLFLSFKTAESAGNMALPGCQESCGGIPIPYPFGIGENCSFSRQFVVNCRPGKTTKNKLEKSGTHPYYDIGVGEGIEKEVVNISIPSGQLSLTLPISSWCSNSNGSTDTLTGLAINWSRTPLWLNNKKNKLIVTGCRTLAVLTLGQAYFLNISAGCLAACDNRESLNKYGTSCSGIGCCQSSIPKISKSLAVLFDLKYNQSEVAEVHDIGRCGYAMVMDTSSGFVFNTTSITTDEQIDLLVPVVYDWVIDNTTCSIAQTNLSSYACKSNDSICVDSTTGEGYICNCSEGYQGNPYLSEGCQDIDECATQKNLCSKQSKCHNIPGGYQCSCSFGWRNRHNDTQNPCELNLALVTGGCVGIVALSSLGFAVLVIVFERRKFSKAKEKYFQQHGGWILLEKIKSNQGFGFTIFTKKQVEQATNNFDGVNIIGQGGQGTVYKGSLRDQIVAIKKCKIPDESKRKEFGKEMVILSQINHKNIVKLLGCCLEVETPMLVYEFIPNGTLHQYIHCEKNGKHFSLITRVRIAQESAEALAYLHSSASPPIFHGDVKSLNILLDQNHTAKVSDFGASVLAPTDEAQFVTLVQGTLGYLDPEYMQSSRLTDKSDVYSFGIVLLELLTRKPVINFDAPEEERGLSCLFLSAMEEDKLVDLLDDEIIHDDDMELITKIAELAKECLHMKGDDRPAMKEVAEELDRINKLHQHPWREDSHHQDSETLLG